MIDFLLFSLGLVLGVTVFLWPFGIMVYSFLVGWPIANRFARKGWVMSGKRPAYRYLVAGCISSGALFGFFWVVLTFSPLILQKGLAFGIFLTVIRVFRGRRAAAIEAYEELYPELNEIGKLIAEDDLARHGISTTVKN